MAGIPGVIRACTLLTLRTGGGGQSLHGQRLIKWFSNLLKDQKPNVPPTAEIEKLQGGSSFKGKEDIPGMQSSSTVPLPSRARERSGSRDLFMDSLSLLPIRARQECCSGRYEEARASLRTFFRALHYANMPTSCLSTHLTDCGEQRGPEDIRGKKDHDGVCTPHEVVLQLRRNTLLALELAAVVIPPADDRLCYEGTGKKNGCESNTFGTMLLCAVRTFPEIRDMIALVELRAAAHHLPRMVDELGNNFEDCDAECDAEGCYEDIEEHVAGGETNENDGKILPKISPSPKDKYFFWFTGGNRIKATKFQCLPKAIYLRLMKLYSCASSAAYGSQCPHPHHPDISWCRLFNPTETMDNTMDSNFYSCATILTDMCLLHWGVSPITLEDQSLSLFPSWEEDLEIWDGEADWDYAVSSSSNEELFTDDEVEKCTDSGIYSRNSEWAEVEGVADSVGILSPKVSCRNLWLWTDDDPPHLDVPSSWCSSEELIRNLMRSFHCPEDTPRLVQKILWPIYRLIPERSHLKARFAFTLGLIASHSDYDGGEGGADLAESLYLECMMVLNRVGDGGDVLDEPSDPSSCSRNNLPLLTKFGVNVLEKLGDALTKNGKYEYGILALERSIDCYALVTQEEKKQHIKLVRRVAMLTLAHKDSHRALQYHVQLLKGAHAENTLNEFIYLALEIARMLVEQGEFVGAEKYLIIASHLLSGAKLDQVQLRPPHGEPTTGSKDCSVTSSCPNSGNLIASGAFPLPKYIPASAAATQQTGSLHQGGGGGSISGSAHSMMSLELNHLSVLPFQAVQAIPEKRLSFTGSEHVPGCSDAAYHRDSMECSGQGGAMDTQRFSLQMKLVELYTVSQQYEKALKVWNRLLLNRSVPGNHRGKVLLGVAQCYLKLNRLAECAAALDRIVCEADENLVVYDTLTFPSAAVSVGGLSPPGSPSVIPTEWEDHHHHPFPFLRLSCTSHLESDKFTSAAHVLSIFSMVKSVDFLSLRAKCHLAAADPVTTLHWIKIAIATCGNSRADAKRGRLFYIKARCHAVLAIMAKERRDGGGCSTSCLPLFLRQQQQPPADEATAAAASVDLSELEKTEVELALEAYARSESLFRKADDVRRLVKCLASESEMHLSRIFVDVTLRGVPLKDSALGDGEAILDMAEAKAGQTLDLAADVASPLAMIVALLNASEVYLLRGRTVLAYKAWKEAQTILTLTYLQRQVVEEYLSEQHNDTELQPSSSSAPHHSAGVGSLEKGECVAASSSSVKGYEHAHHSFWKRRNISWYYPALPSVPHPPSTMKRVYKILSRVIRLSFILTGLHHGTLNLPMATTDLNPLSESGEQSTKCNRDHLPPRSHLSYASSPDVPIAPSNFSSTKGFGVTAGILASSALPNSTHLLAGWLVLDALVHDSYYLPPLSVLAPNDRGWLLMKRLNSCPSSSITADQASPSYHHRLGSVVSSDTEVLQGGSNQSDEPSCNSELDISRRTVKVSVTGLPTLDGGNSNGNELVVDNAGGGRNVTTISSPIPDIQEEVCELAHRESLPLSTEAAEEESSRSEGVVSPLETILSLDSDSVYEEELIPVVGVSTAALHDGTGTSAKIEDRDLSLEHDYVLRRLHNMDFGDSKVQSIQLNHIEDSDDISHHSSGYSTSLTHSDDQLQGRVRANSTFDLGSENEISLHYRSSPGDNSNQHRMLPCPEDFTRYPLKRLVSTSLPNSPNLRKSSTPSSTCNRGCIYSDRVENRSGLRRENVRHSDVSSLDVRQGSERGVPLPFVREGRKSRLQRYCSSVSSSLDVMHHVFVYTNSPSTVIASAAKECKIAYQYDQCGKSSSMLEMGIHHNEHHNSSKSSIMDECSFYASCHTPTLFHLRMTETGQLIEVGFEQPYLDRYGGNYFPSPNTHPNVSMSESSSSGMDGFYMHSSERSGTGTAAAAAQGVYGGGETRTSWGGESFESGALSRCTHRPSCSSRIQYVKSQMEQAKSTIAASFESSHHKGIRKRFGMHLHHNKPTTVALDPSWSMNSMGSSSGVSCMLTNNPPTSGGPMGQGKLNHHHHNRKSEASRLTTLNSWLSSPFTFGDRPRTSLPADYSGLNDVGIVTRSPFELHVGMKTSEKTLWTSFCKLKQANKLYSAGNIPLSDLHSQNLEIMRKIMLTGKEMGRPILRSDRCDLSCRHPKCVLTGKSGKRSGGGRGHGHGQAAATVAPLLRKGTNRFPPISRYRTSGDSATAFGLSMQNKRPVLMLANALTPPSDWIMSSGFGGREGGRPPHTIMDGPFWSNRSSFTTSTTSNSSPTADHMLGSSSGMSDTFIRIIDEVMLPLDGSELGNNSTADKNSVKRRYSSSNISQHRVDMLAGVPLRCRHTYPTAFSFTFFMDGAYFYYCPSTGKMNIKNVFSTCTPPLSPNAGLSTTPSLLDLRWVRGLDDPRTLLCSQGLSKVFMNRHNQTQTSKSSNKSEVVGGHGCASSQHSHHPPSPSGSELYDDVLCSISENQPNRCLPLVPEHDEAPYFLPKDDAVAVVVEVLSPQFTLFLVTALLLEQPVLMVAKPGEEGLLAYVGAGLLRLLRPLQWQYTNLSVCPASSTHILIHCIHSKQPFLIGVHTSTLEYLCPFKRVGTGCCCHKGKGVSCRGNSSSGGERVGCSNKMQFKMASSDIGLSSCTNTPCSSSTKNQGEHQLPTTPTDRTLPCDMNHVTIVDLDNGIVVPSAVLQHAAATTVYHNFAPDADPLTSDTFSVSPAMGMGEVAFDFLRDYGGVQAEISPLGYSIPGMLPPLPAKYRYQIDRRVDAAISSVYGNGDTEKGGAGTKSSSLPSGSEEEKRMIMNSRCAETFRHSMFLLLVNLLKPYHLFLDDGPWETTKSLDGCHGVGMPSMSNVGVEAFLSSHKDEMRPFLRLLLSTKAFSVFINTSAPYHNFPLFEQEGPSQLLNFKQADTASFWEAMEERSQLENGDLMSQRQPGHPQQVNRTLERRSSSYREYKKSASFKSELSNQPTTTTMRTFREEFELAIRIHMRQKLKLYHVITHERIAGYLQTRLVQEGQDASRKTEKRRWCVLDAGRFSYYRSRRGRGRKQKQKGQIALDTRSVTLVIPPFLVRSGNENTTTEANSVALVSATLPPEVACITIRAESFKVHKKWVQALRARLTPKETANKMDRFYSSG